MLYWKRRDSKIPLDEVADSDNSDVEIQIDQTYAPTSPNAQSGTAVSQAVSQLESTITSKYGDALKYKGSVANESALPKNGQNQKGDVYNVQDTGANYAWDGNQWDKLNENLDGYVKQEAFNSLQSSFDTHKQNNDPDLHHLTEEEFAKVGSIEIFSQEAIKEAIDSKIKEQISTGGIITSSDLESKLSELQTQVQQTVTQNVTETLSTDFVNSADFESYKTQHENDLDNFLICEQADELMVYTKNGEDAPPLNERKSRVLYLIGKESTIGSDPVTPTPPPPDQGDEPQESANSMILTVDTTNTNGKVNLGYNLGIWEGSTSDDVQAIEHKGTVNWGDGTSTEFDGTEGIEDNESNRLYHVYQTPDTYEITIEGTVKWNKLNKRYLDNPNSIQQILKKIEIPEGKKSPIYWLNGAAFAYCKLLESISAKLFDNCTIPYFDSCFQACKSLQEIPTGLFDKCINATTFYGCFENCESIQEIPAGLFDNNSEVISFTDCFCGCTNLQAIPEKLFDNCTKVTSFFDCFEYCRNLQAIPTGLFDKCINATSFYGCFTDCDSIQEIPAGLFDKCSAIRDISFCFINCSNIKGTLPNLWDTHQSITSYDRCFQGCTNASNYDQVPAGWGGPAENV